MRTLAEVKADAQAIKDGVDAFPEIVREFCDVSGVAPTRLGYLTCGNPNIVKQLSRNRASKIPTIRKILAFIVNWEPKNAQAPQ